MPAYAANKEVIVQKWVSTTSLWSLSTHQTERNTRNTKEERKKLERDNYDIDNNIEIKNVINDTVINKNS